MSRWTELDSETVLASDWMTVYRKSYLRSDGARVSDYYVVERSPFVLVVARVGPGIAVVREYRPATDREYWALPAGYVEVGETVLEAAVRELAEECGLIASSSRVLSTFDPLPGYLRSEASVVEIVCDSARGLRSEPSENREVRLVSEAEAVELVCNSDHVEMQSCAALLLWTRFAT